MRLGIVGSPAGFLAGILLGLTLTVLPQPVMAQINTVNLSGTVSDPQGLAVGSAKVTVANSATGAERSTTTDGEGQYKIIGLPPGSYTLTVEATGFAKLVSENLVLTLGVAAQYNPQLSLKAATATVTVSGESSVVETTKTDVSATITPTQIDNLPINRRDYIHFTLLTPQAAPDDTPPSARRRLPD